MDQATQPRDALPSIDWTDVEINEVMRLHIIGGLTIGHAQRLVFDKRSEAGPLLV